VRSRSAFLLGAGTAYLFDPRLGRSRRRQLVDRFLGVVRRGRRVGTAKVKFVGGHLRGLLAVLRRFVTRPQVAVDDGTVAQRVRSDAFRDVGVSAREVDVEVEQGFVRLRGTILSTSLSEKLVERVRRTPGVREVSAELRVAD
jgi:BON domain